jgi:hypothetical protein
MALTCVLPRSPEERKRIEAAGGWVVDSRDLNMASLYCLNPQLINEMVPACQSRGLSLTHTRSNVALTGGAVVWFSPQSIPSRLVELVGFITTSRLCGELSVSRAFGDIEYKGALKNEYWGRSFTHVRPPT